jgi:hypothetical protein
MKLCIRNLEICSLLLSIEVERDSYNESFKLATLVLDIGKYEYHKFCTRYCVRIKQPKDCICKDLSHI